MSQHISLVRWLPIPFAGITLPPWGIFIKQGRDSARLRRHELVHWAQYERHGLWGFYAGYVFHWIRAGFSYANHPWEIEARQAE